jgi:hypothetical protein
LIVEYFLLFLESYPRFTISNANHHLGVKSEANSKGNSKGNFPP